MTFVLGIDTGGTYTDGVILNRETKEILVATKALTTHEDLIVGIRNVINQLRLDDIRIDYVALSTTLATNAIVEQNGCRVGLLCLGYTPERELPPCQCKVIAGAMNLSGNEIEALDIEGAKKAVASFGDEVDAIAISGIFSVRNPAHENAVKEAVKDILDVPVIMAHELTGTLGVYERTNTVVLNGRLLSVIAALIAAVNLALKEKDIQAPLMIVKGDGGLMTESVAKERPIDTILSGPAASIIGATYLNDVEEGLVLDIGGTTTDIAVLSNGRPRLTKEGAMVGGWRTRVSAVDAFTFALGGDSHICWNNENGALEVGPRRCNPVSRICREYPGYLKELSSLRFRRIGLAKYALTDGLILKNQPTKGLSLEPQQKEIIGALANGPHTVVEVGSIIGIDANFLHVDELIAYGIVELVGFTPSDVLCALGRYDVGDKEAAALAGLLLANERDLETEAFYKKCMDKIREMLCCDIFAGVLADYKGAPSFSDGAASFYLPRAFGDDRGESFRVRFDLNLPIIGMGAPICAWLPQAAEKFGVKPLISSHYDVANAVGAAAGEVLSSYSLLVKNEKGEFLTIYAPWGKRNVLLDESDSDSGDVIPFEALTEKAVAMAIEEGKTHLKASMERQGIKNYRLLVERKDAMVGNAYSDNVKIFIESNIDVIATGLPCWIPLEEKKKFQF